MNQHRGLSLFATVPLVEAAVEAAVDVAVDAAVEAAVEAALLAVAVDAVLLDPQPTVAAPSKRAVTIENTCFFFIYLLPPFPLACLYGPLNELLILVYLFF